MTDSFAVDCAGVATPEPVTRGLGLFYAPAETRSESGDDSVAPLIDFTENADYSNGSKI
jgi:hypothetical protein